MNVVVGGMAKFTMLDYPGKLACTVFLGGCNFRCPYCHNSSLIRCRKSILEIEDIFIFLKRRLHSLDGVCISGGEPTLQGDLLEFCSNIKELGYSVKLDTNGSNPDMLYKLIDSGIVDYVAMDIKTCIEKYHSVIGTANIDVNCIDKSVSILKSSSIDYEFRTTVVRGLHNISDFKSILSWIHNARRYRLQNFVDCGDVLYSGLGRFSYEDLLEAKSILSSEISDVEIR